MPANGCRWLITGFPRWSHAQARARLPFAIEVIGFATRKRSVRIDLAWKPPLPALSMKAYLAPRDRQESRDGCSQFGLDSRPIGAAARSRSELQGYVELHIEQGPVFECEACRRGL